MTKSRSGRIVSTMNIAIELIHSSLPGVNVNVEVKGVRDSQDAINQIKKTDFWLDNSFKIGKIKEI